MGLESSCPVSRVLMDFWVEAIYNIADKMETLATINPVLYERLELYLLSKYVDDVLAALETMRKGVRWDPESNTMIWPQEMETKDRDRSLEDITMTAMADMASSVLQCLDFTWDTPSRNKNNKMPVLDTMVWVGRSQRTWGIPEAILEEGTFLPTKTGTLKNIILYSFYRKPIAAKTPMNARTAAPAKQLIQTATNEFLRRLRNTIRELPTSHIEEIIREYACDLRRDWFPSELGKAVP